MNKHINNIRHNRDTRAHMPSKEEDSYEEANDKVQSVKKVLEILKKQGNVFYR